MSASKEEILDFVKLFKATLESLSEVAAERGVPANHFLGFMMAATTDLGCKAGWKHESATESDMHVMFCGAYAVHASTCESEACKAYIAEASALAGEQPAGHSQHKVN